MAFPLLGYAGIRLGSAIGNECAGVCLKSSPNCRKDGHSRVLVQRLGRNHERVLVEELYCIAVCLMILAEST